MTPSETLYQFDLAGLSPPKILTLAITGACNLECCHCWVVAGKDASCGHVPLETLLRCVQEFAAIGGTGLRITGGEPFCHPHWLDLVQYCCSQGYKTVAIQTNAMLLNDEIVAVLQEFDFPGLSIQVSLDGVVARTHDLVRGEGAFDGALQGITRLVQGGLGRRVSVFFTEMRHNLGEIPELLGFAERMGLGSVFTGALVLCGRAAETSVVAPPSVEQYLSLLERYEQDVRFRELSQKFGTVSALKWHEGDTVRTECCTFIENPYLTPAGRLYPCLLCHTDEYSVSGVFKKGLEAAMVEGIPLWLSLHHISNSRTDAIAECRDCPGETFCGGGCMGRAWGSCGNLLAADDRCGVRRAIYQQADNSRY